MASLGGGGGERRSWYLHSININQRLNVRNMLRRFTIRKTVRFTFIARRSDAMSMRRMEAVKNPSFIANFSRAQFCVTLNYEEPSDKR